MCRAEKLSGVELTKGEHEKTPNTNCLKKCLAATVKPLIGFDALVVLYSGGECAKLKAEETATSHVMCKPLGS